MMRLFYVKILFSYRSVFSPTALLFLKFDGEKILRYRNKNGMIVQWDFIEGIKINNFEE